MPLYCSVGRTAILDNVSIEFVDGVCVLCHLPPNGSVLLFIPCARAAYALGQLQLYIMSAPAYFPSSQDLRKPTTCKQNVFTVEGHKGYIVLNQRFLVLYTRRSYEVWSSPPESFMSS